MEKKNLNRQELLESDEVAASLDRRGFLRFGSYVVGGAAALQLVGCGSEPCPEATEDNSDTQDPTDSETDPVYENSMTGADCEVAFPEGFKCDNVSEGGLKHTPVISSYDDSGDTYDFTVVVPHVVNADHHILGTQVVAYIPGALTPHNWIDFHYLTQEYILSADDSEYTHTFSISKDLVNSATTHLMVFSLCNKHGAHGEATALEG